MSTQPKVKKPSYTEGEWQVADYLDKESGSRHLAVWQGEHKTICLVSPKGTETAEDYANAQLIATAPEMHKSLIQCVDEIAYLLAEIKSLRPGSYRAQSTLSNAKSVLEKSVATEQF